MNTNILPDLHSGVSSSTERAANDDGGSCRLVAYGNLLVPIDFSEHSKKTIEYATQLAALSHGSIKILHVLQMPENLAAFYEGIYIEQEVINTHVERVKRKANDQLSLVTEQILAKGLNAQPALRVGNPYEEIVSAAKEMGADLIVIGSHGHGGLGRLLLGSTAERVLQYAPCAVLVVK
jgi:nucleotide-binding universal stress UspA family protein